ncbi:hypothetical protein ACQP4Q_02500 [Actinobacillus pleuropneumoniae]|uniref:hypothetical protein n=1 Tax=Actinobacillus pleuropneumoniae TaxID=715 RepID=UPI00208E7E49|nr:hypothetical protein [Actinobacillus pleuropneumoniae]USQ17144.1 hypothetical protein J3K87_02565 [Actinobacillus pleuropneumoniae]
MMNIILLLIFTAALGLLFLLRLYNKRKKIYQEGGDVQGIQTFDNVGNITFNTDEKLFKYIGTRYIKYGKFSFTVTERYEGNLFFIVTILSSTYRKQPTAYRTNIPNLIHLQHVSVSGDTISGEVVCLFPWNLPADDSDYIQITYGAY